MLTLASQRSAGGLGREVTLDALLDGSLRVVDIQRSGTTFRVVLRTETGSTGPALSLREQSVVRRLALGHCQKGVAYDFGLAHTTVSSHLRSALDKLGLPRWETAVLVTAAVDSVRTHVEPVQEGAVQVGSEDPSDRFLVLRCELAAPLLGMLTPAERAVALLIVDGHTNTEIAEARQGSARTVANQVSSLFRKVGVHGRCELIRRLVLYVPVDEGAADGPEPPPHSSAGPRHVPTSPDSPEAQESPTEPLSALG